MIQALALPTVTAAAARRRPGRVPKSDRRATKARFLQEQRGARAAAAIDPCFPVALARRGVAEAARARVGWGRGPWDREPDKYQWTARTGAAAVIVRGPEGHWNGYVAVTHEHPLWGKRANECAYKGDDCPDHQKTLAEIRESLSADTREMFERMVKYHPDERFHHCHHRPDSHIDVHGGLTYGGFSGGDLWVAVAPRDNLAVWWFGFDCAHAGDYSPRMGARSAEAEGRRTPRYHHDARLRAATANDLRVEVYHTMPYVRQQVENLALQLSEFRPPWPTGLYHDARQHHPVPPLWRHPTGRNHTMNLNGVLATELPDAANLTWVKAGRSNPSGNCVQMTALVNGDIAVSNSRDASGRVLVFTRSEIKAFVGGAQDGDFDQFT